jgi:hypothetical protein
MKKYSIDNFIGVFDGFFEKSYCNDLIKYFNMRQAYSENISDTKRRDRSLSFNHQNDIDRTTRYNIDPLESPALLEVFQTIFWKDCYEKYLNEYSYSKQMSHLAISSMKIQKTIPGGGYHPFHFESLDSLTSKRVMFVILYLNDVNYGGETEFLYQQKRVEPKTGRLLLSPAAYTHPHRGNPPLEGEKYILTTWIEFGN